MTAAAPPALASRTAAATPERAQLLQAELEKLRERMRAEATAEAEGEAEAEAEGAGAGFRLRAAPRGASEGLDWTELRSRVMEEEGEGGTYELCCYVDHEPTSTQARSLARSPSLARLALPPRPPPSPSPSPLSLTSGPLPPALKVAMWRDKRRRRIVLSFRGTARHSRDRAEIAPRSRLGAAGAVSPPPASLSSGPPHPATLSQARPT